MIFYIIIKKLNNYQIKQPWYQEHLKEIFKRIKK